MRDAAAAVCKEMFETGNMRFAGAEAGPPLPPAPQHLRDQVARRVVLGVAGDRDPDAQFAVCVLLVLRERFGPVVGPFGVERRTQQPQRRRDGRLAEPGHPVDGAQRGDDERALGQRQQRRALRPCSAGPRASSLSATTSASPCASRVGKVARVADVDQVEQSVGEHQPPGRLAAEALGQLFPGRDLRLGRPLRFAPALSRSAARSRPRPTGRRAALHHHEASGDVGQLRGLDATPAGGQPPVNTAMTVSPAPVTSTTRRCRRPG